LKSVLFLSSEFPPQPGGIGRQAHGLAMAWSHQGLQVTVLTNSRGDSAEERQFDTKLPVRVIRVRRHVLSVFTYLHRLIEAFRLLRRERSPAWVWASGAFWLWVAVLLRWVFPAHQYLGILHGSELGGGGRRRRLTRLALRYLPKHIAVSAFTGRLARTCGARQVHVIPNGFDPGRLQPSGKGMPLCGSPALLTLGRMHRRKGQHNLIRALSKLRGHFPQVHYHLAGLPVDAGALHMLAASLNVSDAVTFHGRVPEGKLGDLYLGADLFVLLSEEGPQGEVEGFGIAVLEANACGLPALGSRGTGLEEAIRDGYSGRVVDPRNEEEITAAVREILADHPRFSLQARIWARSFHWEMIARRYLELL
jgi:phosphatidylinositol alpha-1,6-mannosyltransferase